MQSSRSAVEVETARGRITARALIVTVSTGVLAAEKIKFTPELPKRQLDAIAKLSLGSFDHIALELKGNPLQLQNDDLVFERATGPRTAALLANVSGTSLCLVDVAGKFGRELSAQGEAAMVDFATGWLGDLFGADVKKAVGKTHATGWNREPLALGAMSAAAPGGQAWPQSADGAGARPLVLCRRSRARNAVGHGRRRLGVGRARGRCGA